VTLGALLTMCTLYHAMPCACNFMPCNVYILAYLFSALNFFHAEYLVALAFSLPKSSPLL